MIFQYCCQSEWLGIEIPNRQAHYNQWLSVRRAKSVADYFINHGIDEAQITYTGMGEKNPIASNQTVDGQAQNRRVEILLN